MEKSIKKCKSKRSKDWKTNFFSFEFTGLLFRKKKTERNGHMYKYVYCKTYEYVVRKKRRLLKSVTTNP